MTRELPRYFKGDFQNDIREFESSSVSNWPSPARGPLIATALGRAIPLSILLRADEQIE